MPGFDGTGPQGMGAMTGGGRGGCATPYGGVRPVARGAFYGRGSSRGWRNRYYATGVPGRMVANAPYANPVSPQQERDMLAQETVLLRQELDTIQQRIQSLEQGESA